MRTSEERERGQPSSCDLSGSPPIRTGLIQRRFSSMATTPPRSSGSAMRGSCFRRSSEGALPARPDVAWRITTEGLAVLLSASSVPKLVSAETMTRLPGPRGRISPRPSWLACRDTSRAPRLDQPSGVLLRQAARARCPRGTASRERRSDSDERYLPLPDGFSVAPRGRPHAPGPVGLKDLLFTMPSATIPTTVATGMR